LLTAVRRAVGGASGRAVIFSTHILEDIDAIADRVLVLQRGRLILDAPLHEIRANQGARSIAAVLYEMLGAA
jgi:ABC-2 type transport system ATP-binding protein